MIIICCVIFICFHLLFLCNALLGRYANQYFFPRLKCHISSRAHEMSKFVLDHRTSDFQKILVLQKIYLSSRKIDKVKKKDKHYIKHSFLCIYFMKRTKNPQWKRQQLLLKKHSLQLLSIISTLVSKILLTLTSSLGQQKCL